MRYLRASLTPLLCLINLHCGPPRDGHAPTGRLSPTHTVKPVERHVPASSPAPEDLKPLTRPGEMPSIDHSVLPAPEDRWQDPAAQERHRAIMDQLWTTTLGQLYLAYLTDEVPAITVPGRARQLVDRITEQGQHVGKRKLALQAFDQDLYSREQMSEDIVKRALLMRSIFEAKETSGQEQHSNRVGNMMIWAAIISIPLGIPAVREEIANIFGQVRGRCLGQDCTKLAAVNWGRLRNVGDLRRSWTLTGTGGQWLALGGTAGLLYDLGFMKLPGWRKNVDLDKEMLNGREGLLHDAEF